MTANRGQWNPTEYLHRSKDPGQSRQHMRAIEEWKERTLEENPHHIPTRETIKLEAHFRHQVMAFMGAQALSPKDTGNALVTALANTLGLVMFDAVASGATREAITLTIMQRINAVFDDIGEQVGKPDGK